MADDDVTYQYQPPDQKPQPEPERRSGGREISTQDYIEAKYGSPVEPLPPRPEQRQSDQRVYEHPLDEYVRVRDAAQPPDEGSMGTAFRHFVHALPAMGTGAVAGTALAGPLGTVGGFVAGALAGIGESYAQSKLTQTYWPEEQARLEASEQQHPWAATAGRTAAMAPFFELAPGLALQQRLTGAVLGGGTDAAVQYAQKGEVDPVQAGISAAGGALFGGPRTYSRAPAATETGQAALPPPARQLTYQPPQRGWPYPEPPPSRPPGLSEPTRQLTGPPQRQLTAAPEQRTLDLQGGYAEPQQMGLPLEPRGQPPDTQTRMTLEPRGQGDLYRTETPTTGLEPPSYRVPTRSDELQLQGGTTSPSQLDLRFEPRQQQPPEVQSRMQLEPTGQGDLFRTGTPTTSLEPGGYPPGRPDQKPAAMAAAAKDEVNVLHGTPGAKGGRGTAEVQPPPDQTPRPAATLDVTRSERNLGKDMAPEGAPAGQPPPGVNVRGDPDLKAAAAARPAQVERGGFTIQKTPEGQYAVQDPQGNVVSTHPYLGQAQLGQLKAAKAAGWTPETQQGLARGVPGVRRPPRGERLKITPAERELGAGQTPTQPIPILERGAQRVQEGVPPGTPQPPERQAMTRPGAKPQPGRDKTLAKRYESVSDDALKAALKRTDLPPGHAEAATNEMLRRTILKAQQMGSRTPPPGGGPQAQTGGGGRQQPPPPPGGGASAGRAGAGGYQAPPGGGRQPPPPPPPGGGQQPPGGQGPQGARGPGGPGPGAGPTAPGLRPADKSDLQQGLLASLRRQFGGMLGITTESKERAKAAIQRATGPLERLKAQTQGRFTNEMYKLANKMDQGAFERFVNAYERGQVHTLPKEQQELANVLKQNYGDFWKAVQQLPEKRQAIADYLAHMYDNSNGQVNKFVNDYYGGGGGSLRQRTHPTFADAKAAGLTPLSSNPIEHFVRYSEGMSHYLAQRQMMLDLGRQGRIGYFNPKVTGASGTPSPNVRGLPPDGYAEIKAPWAEKNGLRAYAPRDAAETINQFYDAGLARGQIKDIYDFARYTKNMWTAVELGLSAYHATTVGTESVASGMARAMQQAARGDYVGATKSLVQSPIEPVLSALTGRTGMKIYRDTTGTMGTPIQRKIIDTLTKADIRPGNLKSTGEYDMTHTQNFWDSYKQGSLPNEFKKQIQDIKNSYGLKAPQVFIDNIGRAVQTLSKPLFQHYIPNLKLGTMMKDMEAWYHANPNATEAEAVAYARRVSDSIDNRMGEMNMDHVMMNKTAKQAAILGLRSFGFTIGGPFREIGGGVASGIKAAAQGKNPLADPRTAYAMAFIPTIMGISAAYQFMKTGKGPEDIRDLFAPQTGGTVKGQPERVILPGYHKDFLGYFVNPAGPMEEFKNKLAAPITAIKEQLMGEDWRGKPYVPPRATTLEWLQAHAQNLGGHMLPIGPKQLYEGRPPGTNLSVPEQLIGLRSPGGYLTNPQGTERAMTARRQRDWAADEKAANKARAERGLPPLPKRQLPTRGYQEGGPVEPDYDLEAARRAGVQPDERGHMPDTYKLPNHMTFSEESIHSNPQTPGGRWEWMGHDERAHDLWNFRPTDYNLQQHPANEMERYFNRYEPDSTVQIPGREPIGYQQGGPVDEDVPEGNWWFRYGYAQNPMDDPNDPRWGVVDPRSKDVLGGRRTRDENVYEAPGSRGSQEDT